MQNENTCRPIEKYIILPLCPEKLTAKMKPSSIKCRDRMKKTEIERFKDLFYFSLGISRSALYES